jgi:hypothetical protein
MAPSPHLPTDMHGDSSHAYGGKFSMIYFSTKKIFLINFLKIYFSDLIEKNIFYLLIYHLLKNIAF